MINDKDFLKYEDGFYKPYFEKYIEFKRGKGEKVTRSTLVRLRALNNTLNQYNAVEISRETVEKLLAVKPGEKSASRQLRVSDLRQFAAFLSTYGIHAYVVPKKYMKTPYIPFKPYIFSEEELKRIVYAADNLPAGKRSQKHISVYPVIVRILIGTGLRISELLALTKADVNSETGLIKVINSKNGVSRYVPVSDSLRKVLHSYKLPCRRNGTENEAFFISPYTDGNYSYSAMKYMFQKIYSMAGIYTPEGRLPKIHDVRHTFCTKSLEQMLASGMNLYTAVPILAAYVGHVNIRDTEHYIHLTRNNHEFFIDSESTLKGIIPEVSANG